jgi:hypothetical protein
MSDTHEKSSRGGAVRRRSFLASAATATAGFTIVPRHVLGGQGTPAPSDKLNLAAVGVGGMGKENLGRCATLDQPRSIETHPVGLGRDLQTAVGRRPAGPEERRRHHLQRPSGPGGSAQPVAE